MFIRTITCAALAVAGAIQLAACPARAGNPLYVLESQTVLPSTDTDWDYAKLEPDGTRLFIARRKDGLTVFDTKSKKHVTIDNSVGANGPLLLPQFNRGYAAMTDGTLLSFDLKTLRVIDRIKLDDGNLNGAVYEPTTQRVHVVVGPRPAETTWYTIDARTGKLLGSKTFPFRKMDDPSPDGRGFLYAPARYDGLILKLDARTLEEKSRWMVKDCEQAVVAEYHAASNRVLVGCRGDKPIFTAFNPDTGEQLGSLPIGQGIDGMGVDDQRHRILVSTGGNATLGVIQQDGPDSYRLLGNVQTRPMARIMQVNERTGAVHIVTADHTVGASDANGVAPVTFHPNSFTVLTYRPQ